MSNDAAGANGTGGTAPAGVMTVMERLKTRTAEHHRRAEQHPFQASLIRGQLPLDSYTEYLGQMLLVHARLESRLREAMAGRTPVIARVVRPYQFQEPYLRQDLARFGVDPAAVRPTPATARIAARIDELAQSTPLALLGMHYVLEGSNNGSAFIARAIRKTFNLAPGDGDRYLDPYGPLLRERWGAFKIDMDAVGFSDADADVLVAAAAEMFDAVTAISADLHASMLTRQPAGA